MGDELGQGERRRGVLVEDATLPVAGAHPRQAGADRDPHVAEPRAEAEPRPRRQQTVVVEQKDAALRVEQAARALDDEVEQPLGLQLGRELALDVGERLDLRAPALLEGEQARVFEGDGRLARERRQELDLVRREGRTRWPADQHRALRPLSGERERQERPGSPGRQPLARLWPVPDRGVPKGVARPHGLLRGDRAARDALAGLEAAEVDGLCGRGRPRQQLEVRLVAEQVHRDVVHVEALETARRHDLDDLRRLEARDEQARRLRQGPHAGRLPAHLHIEAGVLERHRRLGREVAGAGEVVRSELGLGQGAGDDKHADHPLPDEERLGEDPPPEPAERCVGVRRG